MKILVAPRVRTLILALSLSMAAPVAQAETAEQLAKTLLTCPNGALVIQQVKALGNVLGQVQSETLSGQMIERGSATIIQSPSALNSSIMAPDRLTGCLFFSRSITSASPHNQAQTCQAEVVRFRDGKSAACPTTGKPVCQLPPCAAPPMGCHYSQPETDAFGCPQGCGQLLGADGGPCVPHHP